MVAGGGWSRVKNRMVLVFCSFAVGLGLLCIVIFISFLEVKVSVCLVLFLLGFRGQRCLEFQDGVNLFFLGLGIFEVENQYFIRREGYESSGGLIFLWQNLMAMFGKFVFVRSYETVFRRVRVGLDCFFLNYDWDQSIFYRGWFVQVLYS